MPRQRFVKSSLLHYRHRTHGLTTTSTEHFVVPKRFLQTGNADGGGENGIFTDPGTISIPHMGHGVRVGQYASMKRTYTLLDIQEFGRLVHDFNPLHSPQHFVERGDNDGTVGACTSNTVMGQPHVASGLIQMDDDGCTSKPLVHGMLVSSIFSSIFSSLAPGCVYMNQTLDFIAPVHAGDTIVANVKVERIRKWRKGGVVVQCRTEALKESVQSDQEANDAGVVVAIKGNANVWLPNGYEASS